MGESESEPKPKPPVDQIVTSRQRVQIAGQQLEYSVTVGTIVLREEDVKEGNVEPLRDRATIFFVAYTRDDVEDRHSRPITFAFNGGPGSSSVWLHLGLFGPRLAPMGSGERQPPPPYRLEDNPHSLLDVSDLVFIDPIGTGYSRPVAGEPAKRYHGFNRDIESVGDFIRLYTSRYGRWLSPKYLAGESYGTTRAAGLSGYLQQRHGLYLNGLMLISAVLSFATLEFDPGNDLPYLLFLPTYTATAFYHRRLPEPLQSDLRVTLAEVEEFIHRDYAPALLRGSRLEPERRAIIAAQLARYTGLSIEYIERSNIRIRDDRFVSELLRDQRRTVGRLDSRFTGIDRDAVGERFERDPSMAAIMGPYTAALNAYIRDELGFASDLPYEILTGRVHPWSYAEHENKYVDVADTLRAAIATNPYLRVHIASGYYDLATPYYATEYTLDHLALEAEQRNTISVSYYEAGHMMYIHPPALAELKRNLAAFISGDRLTD